jgi:hypothetical protein
MESGLDMQRERIERKCRKSFRIKIESKKPMKLPRTRLFSQALEDMKKRGKS